MTPSPEAPAAESPNASGGSPTGSFRGVARQLAWSALFALAAAVTARAETTFYQARVAPILDRHCVSCHGPEKQKAKLRLDSFEAVMRGAESEIGRAHV